MGEGGKGGVGDVGGVRWKDGRNPLQSNRRLGGEFIIPNQHPTLRRSFSRRLDSFLGARSTFASEIVEPALNAFHSMPFAFRCWSP